jgi:hypothetical protein
LKDFLKQISPRRWATIGALLAALAISGVIDALTDWWDGIPFLTNVVSSILLLGLTVLLVEEYLSFRADRAWQPVAGFALQDVGTAARDTWVRLASFIQPDLPQPPHPGAWQHQITSREGYDQQVQRLNEIVKHADRREHLHGVLYRAAERTREILTAWAPVMVHEEHLAKDLSRFSSLHQVTVQTAGHINREIQGDQLPISPEDLHERVMEIQRLALALDGEFHKRAEELAPITHAPTS